MIHKDLFRRLLVGFYVLTFTALLFGLTRYSYRAKELLVCWLFFCSFFAVLALILLGGALAAFAGQHFLKFFSVVKLIIPELAAAIAEVPQGVVSVPPILAATTLEFSGGPCRPVAALDSCSYFLIEPAPVPAKAFSEMDVQNRTDSIVYIS